MTSDKREKAIKYLTEEIWSLRMAPKINGCGPENWAEQLEIMETCLEAVRAYHIGEATEMVPLTLEQLREMDRQPVKVKNLEDEEGGINIGVVTMFDPNDSDNGVNVGCAFFCIKEYGKTWIAYAYPPAHIDREAWTECEVCECERIMFRATAVIDCPAGSTDVCGPVRFCPWCGRPQIPEAWEELEKRLRR